MSTEIIVRDEHTPVLITLSSAQLIESAKKNKVDADGLMTSAILFLSRSTSSMQKKWAFLKEVRDAAAELNKTNTPQEGK